ncbi:MAG: arsenic efflux protein [Bacteroidales bacterium]|nr:arsenic efflux protein [Bacteroidales bacterium]
MTHLIIDILRNSILITGLVTIMMMMIESFNIESHGKFFSGLRKSRSGQIVIAALLGSVPGCMGGFATVSLYTHRMMSFGALIAMMIASSGDEAFVIMAMLPDQAIWIFAILFITAIVAGIATDLIHDSLHRKRCDKEEHCGCGDTMQCEDGYKVHEHEKDSTEKARHFGWKRIVMFAGVAVFIAALATGRLAHEHEHGHSHQDDNNIESVEQHNHSEIGIDLLSEDWMNVLFACLSVFVLGVLAFSSDHFVDEHLWEHIVKRHLPGIFLWTFGVLALIGIGLHYIDISGWISDNTALMILLAVLIGIIPESGPHMIFVTLYASGIVSLPVLLASCISQDGHSSIPLLAESKKSFLKAKLINCAVALAVGFGAMLFI